jgi:hypothetical protein
MMAIGCIQSQKCHTDRCPTGVATQDPWLVHGLDPVSKAERCAQYVRTFRKELVKVSESVGVAHPGLITTGDVDIFRGDYEAQSLRAVYGYKEGWGQLGPQLTEEITKLMAPRGLEPEERSIEAGEGEKKPARASTTTSGL